jgi:hypothetical protein
MVPSRNKPGGYFSGLVCLGGIAALPVGMLVCNYADVRIPLFGGISCGRASSASFFGTPVAQMAAVALSVTRGILGELSTPLLNQAALLLRRDG